MRERKDKEIETAARNYVKQQYQNMGKWEDFASPSEEFERVVAEIVRVLKEARESR